MLAQSRPRPPDRSSRLTTVPNLLSALRLASVPVFLWLFLSGYEDAAVILYGAGALSDFLDGFIARRFNQVSELGKVLDPLADRILIITLAVALVARGTLPLWLALAVVVRDLIVLTLFPLLERRGVPRIPVNFTGKTATALLLTGLTWLALSETSFAVFRSAASRAIATGITLAGAVLYYVAAGMYARQARLALGPVRPAGSPDETGE